MFKKRLTAGAVCLVTAFSTIPTTALADETAGFFYEDNAADDTIAFVSEAVNNLRSGNATESAYTIAWDKVKNADGYRVYRRNKNTKKYELIADTAKTRVRISGLAAGQKDSYRVTAYNNENGEMTESPASTEKFTTKPARVELLKVKKNGKGYVTFRWRRVKNASVYELYYSKDGKKYKRFKTVSGKKGEVKTGLVPKGQKLRFKVRAVSVTGKCSRAGKCSPSIKSIAFNNLSVNKIMNKYKNSRSVTQANSQGFKLSGKLKGSLTTQLTKLGGDAGYILYDIDSGSAVGYNANKYFDTASTVKMPYVLYCLRCMEDGKPSIKKQLTYKPSDYNGGSSWIKTQPFYSKYTIKRVIELIGEYSDNCGYYMLQDEFGYSGYNKFIKKLGAKPWINSSVRWGYVSACDSAREWENMWDYMNTGRYRKFAKRVFSTSCVANIRDQLGGRYVVYEKSGWTGAVYNETALVAAKHPYIIICLTTRTSAERMRSVAEVSESIHNAMWKYYDK